MAEIVVRFWSLVVAIHSRETLQHHRPHFHVTDAEHTASVAIDDGEVLAGYMRPVTHHAIRALVRARGPELMAAWNDVRAGRKPVKIHFVPK